MKKVFLTVSIILLTNNYAALAQTSLQQPDIVKQCQRSLLMNRNPNATYEEIEKLNDKLIQCSLLANNPDGYARIQESRQLNERIDRLNQPRTTVCTEVGFQIICREQ